MRIVNLASGSKGNSTFLSYDNIKLLIDVGISERRIKAELESIGESIDGIRAVLITHEHTDHIHALKSLAKKFNFDVYVHGELAESESFKALAIPENRVKTFEKEPFCVGEIEIMPFDIFHDSLCPVGFVVNVRGSKAKVGFVTDTGMFDENMVKALSGVKMIFIESNYDENLLKHGNYPYNIKKRILSDFGHLSNLQSLELAKRLFESGTKCFILSHLSENNNSPEIAYSNYADYFAQEGYTLDKDVVLRLSFQHKHGNNFILNEEFNGK